MLKSLFVLILFSTAYFYHNNVIIYIIVQFSIIHCLTKKRKQEQNIIQYMKHQNSFTLRHYMVLIAFTCLNIYPRVIQTYFNDVYITENMFTITDSSIKHHITSYFFLLRKIPNTNQYRIYRKNVIVQFYQNINPNQYSLLGLSVSVFVAFRQSIYTFELDRLHFCIPYILYHHIFCGDLILNVHKKTTIQLYHVCVCRVLELLYVLITKLN